ncbi:MAG: transporter substrate-binding domain-containing protein [Clostridia bacterium]|nr:transporter substrate-binding domain-containing protein [Clostridia bacterium]
MKKFLCLMLAVMLVLSFGACSKQAEPTDASSDAQETATTGTSYDNLAIACELTSEEYGIGFRKGSDLTAEVNKIMDELMADGTLDAIAQEYKLTLVKDAEADSAAEATVADLEYVKGNGKLVIGITDYAPMNYLDDKGQWTGFDTEFAQAVCAKLGVEAEFVEIEWDNKFLSLESKAIDCIWNGMTISEEVLANTSCSKAYVKNAQVLVVDKDKAADYKDPASIKDLTVAVEAGSAGLTAAKECGVTNIVEVTAQTDAVLEVSSKSCDACIIDITMANAMIGK